MNLALKPIKTLITASILLHIASLIAVAIIIALQIPLGTTFFMDDMLFVLPHPIAIARIAIIFIVHLVLAASFYKPINVNDAERLRTLSNLSFIFVLIVLPILVNAFTRVENLLLSFQGSQYFASSNVLRALMFYGLSIRTMALSALLIAASMAFYYCFLIKSGKDLQ